MRDSKPAKFGGTDIRGKQSHTINTFDQIQRTKRQNVKRSVAVTSMNVVKSKPVERVPLIDAFNADTMEMKTPFKPLNAPAEQT